MVSSTRLGIQDYIKKAGLGGDFAGLRRPPSALNSDSGKDFSGVLEGLRASVQAPAVPSNDGMRIGDYRQRPVSARIPILNPALQTGVGRPLLPDEPPLLPAVSVEGIPAVDMSAVAPETMPAETSTADKIAETIRAAAAKYDLPAGLIHSVIRAESNFQPRVVSRAGAQGLMQLMPATAAELGVQDPFDIEQNIDGGARYLRRMLDRFGGDLKQALAAYNAGPGTVMRYNGNVPYAETRNYVQKVLAYSRRSPFGQASKEV